MKQRPNTTARHSRGPLAAALVCLCLWALASPINIFSDSRTRKPVRPVVDPSRPTVIADSLAPAAADTLVLAPGAPEAAKAPAAPARIFNPDPVRAVWLSALCPGLGQLYNRRYWKLPIVVGAYVGLGYATSWNNSMLRDYTRAYADLMDNDPDTRSYMNFFPSTTREEDLNTSWLQTTFKNRKDMYRRNRDLCIICMVGVYLLAMVDAYVDATLTHFDISPDLSLDVAPAVIAPSATQKPAVGLQWALNF